MALGSALQSRYARRFLGQPVRVLVETGGSGYTDHYVRARVPAQSPEGSFRDLVPSGLTEEGMLVG
jgi:hypothetical protein